MASTKSLDEANATDSYIDSFGSQCLSVFRQLGLPSTVVLIRVSNLSHDSFVCCFFPLIFAEVISKIFSANPLILFQDLPDDVKSKHELKKMCTSTLASEFREDCKFYAADKEEELHKVLHCS